MVEHYLNNDINKTLENEINKINNNYNQQKSSENEIKVIDEFYNSTQSINDNKISKEIKDINKQKQEEIIKADSNNTSVLANKESPEVIRINKEENEDKLIVSKKFLD